MLLRNKTDSSSFFAHRLASSNISLVVYLLCFCSLAYLASMHATVGFNTRISGLAGAVIGAVRAYSKFSSYLLCSDVFKSSTIL